MSQQKAKDFAAKHGYKLRRVPHSAANPNGYIKVIAAVGRITGPQIGRRHGRR